MQDANKPFDMAHVLETPAEELAEEMYAMFMPTPLEKIETREELNEAQKLMSWCAANNAYLSYMAQALKMKKREMKREGADKKSFDEILSKEEAFTTFAEICKRCHDTTSRMLTVWQMSMEEMRLSGSIS